MKKILIILSLLVATTFTSQAQFMNFGVRGGAGMGVHVDDLANNSPILAANLGGFVSFGFTNSQSLFFENFWLQTGLNITRRGSHFEEVLEDIVSIREGVYDAFYVQVPLLATYRYELPIREPGHRALISLGPAFSYGLFGSFSDRKSTPGYPQEDWTYRIENEPVFDYIDPLDVSFLFGVGYEWQDLSVMLQLDYGLLAVSKSPDALETSQSQSNGNTINKVKVVPQGNNFALLLTIGYQFPIR
ncbi:MAG: PorT family protein [Bacteroidales bacterium]|nr:PorT family protein [Candidatus Colimorpha merdihippi]MCQ2282845.1 PorT family protein [Bacteroidales bacterium]